MFLTRKKLNKILEEFEKENRKALDKQRKKYERELKRKERETQAKIKIVKDEYEKKIEEIVDQVIAETYKFSQPSLQGQELRSWHDDSYVYQIEDARTKDVSYILKNKDIPARLKKAIQEGDSGWVTLGLSGLEDIKRNQTLEELWNLQDAAFNKSRLDPHARAIVDNLQRFTIGRGMKFEAADKKVQKVLEDFWFQNQMEMRQKQMVRSAFIEGEYFVLYFINETTGRVKIRKVRPKEILDIETHPEDIETILSYKRQFVRKNEITTIIYADIDYFNQLRDPIDAAKSEFHNKLSRDKLIQFIKYGTEDEIRGRVPMDSILRYLKFYEDWIVDRIRLNHERSKVVWIKEVTGGGPEVRNLQPTRSPKGGMMLIETDRVRYRIENSNINADRAKDDGLAILYSIGAGVTMPLALLDQRVSEEVYSCYETSETEILTPFGWKNIGEIEIGEIVGTVNSKTLEFEWQHTTDTDTFDYKGPMYHFHSRGFDCLVTPNHNMFVSNFHKSKKGWKLQRADSIETEHFSVNCGLNWQNDQVIDIKETQVPDFINVSKETWLKFLGIYIGDGSITIYNDRNKYYTKLQFHIKKNRKKDYFSPILTKMRFTLNERNGDQRWHLFEKKELNKWILENIGRYSYEKRIPSFIFSLPKNELKIFFEALMQSDGHYDPRKNHTSSCYCTTSSNLAEDVLLLALRLGYRAYIVERPLYTKNRKRVYYVRMSEHKMETLTRKDNITIVNKECKVSCVTVPNKVIVTRRNGKIAVAGNSIRKAWNPFSQMILDNQDFWSINFDKMFRVIIRAAVQANKLPEQVKVRRFSDAKLAEILNDINSMILEGKKSMEEIVKEGTRMILEGPHENVSVNTDQVPISKVFPEIVQDDPLEQAQVLEIYKRIGIASTQTLSERAGFIYGLELFRMQQEQLRNQGSNKKNDTKALPEPNPKPQ